MQKLPAVEQAKTLLQQTQEWGIMKWLTDKRKVREAADNAWAAFDEQEEQIRTSWPENLQKAYADLAAQEEPEPASAPAKRKPAKAKKNSPDVPPKVKAQAAQLKEAEEQAYSVRMEAEDMFVQAEKRMSIPMAREGAQKAIEAFAAREKLLRKFEAVRS
jgi:hypothetical protein